MEIDITAGNLKCNGMKEPLGIACEKIRLTWQLCGNGMNVRQKAYEVRIWDSGHQEVYTAHEDDRRQFCYPDCVFEGETRYYFRVRAKITSDVGDGWTKWSRESWFETAFADYHGFHGAWTEAVFSEGAQGCPELHKGWVQEEKPVSVRLYISAHGLYDLRLNGEHIGTHALTPDFTAYDKCIYYQTFDVTQQIRVGQNDLCVILGDGWYAGHAQGIPGTDRLYGDRPAVIFQMNCRYEDGRRSELFSDGQMTAQAGEIVTADLFMGEFHDYRRDQIPGTAAEKEGGREVLTPQQGALVEEVGRLYPVECHRLSDGAWVVDFGQVCAGREHLTVRREAGEKIVIEHSELLAPDGSGDLADIIPAFPWHDQKNTFLLDGKERELYPRFSFQGFRYLKITGLKEFHPEDCFVEVISTAMEDRSRFSCSDQRIGRLVENAKWSQRSNMISIPTDCPQRERAGFTGDASVYAKTAAWHGDVEGFLARWLSQCRLEQLERGQIPITVPYTKAYRDVEPNRGWTSAGWGDAIIFVSLDLYKMYGDAHILADNYGAMERWMHYAAECARDMMPERCYMDFDHHGRQQYLWNAGFQWGDWQLPGFVPAEGALFTKEITASLFYYREAAAMARISGILGFEERRKEYAGLAEHIRQAFHEEYIRDGRLTQEIQGSYCMAVAFGMAEGEEKRRFAARLNELVIQSGYHLQTGFLSTPHLLDVLWDNGYRDTAWKVLFQDTAPSWLYEVGMGATTIWEDWEGIRQDGTIVGTSFNHYAFGCVCDFIYRRIAGVTPLEPGFAKAAVQIHSVPGINSVDFSYRTGFGELQVRWQADGEKLDCRVNVPHNMTVSIFYDGREETVGSGEFQWQQIQCEKSLEIT